MDIAALSVSADQVYVVGTTDNVTFADLWALLAEWVGPSWSGLPGVNPYGFLTYFGDHQWG